MNESDGTQDVNEILGMSHVMSGSGMTIPKIKCPSCGQMIVVIIEVDEAFTTPARNGDMVIHGACGSPGIVVVNAETGEMSLRPPTMSEVVGTIYDLLR